jgi:hypothetical protein
LLTAITAAATGGIGYWAGHRAGLREARPPTPLVAATPSVAPIVSPALAGAPIADGAPALADPPAAPAHFAARGLHRGAGARTEAATKTDSLAIELRGLRNAERALRNGNPGLALAFLRELDRQVPQGHLREERDAAIALSRCASVDRPFGIDLAKEFVDGHPGSVYRDRVEQACSPTDSPTPGDSPARRPDR